MFIKIKSVSFDYSLYALFTLFFPASLILSLYYPNVILQQGLSHRIFYFHVSVAWVALYAPFFSSLFGIAYLYKKDIIWDLRSYSMNKIAIVFAICVLFSGPIWAKSAWGTPWDWTDARLQSFFILVISLGAYFIIRNLVVDIRKKAIISAFLSIICAFNALITWGAIRWIDNPGNHPGSVLGKSGMDSDMRVTFWLSVFAYHLLFLLLYILIHRHDRINYSLFYLRETKQDN